MFNRKSKRSREANAELNITAFMNLMVVLVPFLLITAVFSQVSILNLNLPTGTSEALPTDEEPPKALEVVIRADKFDVLERNSGLLKRIENTEEGYDFKGLNEFLQQVKAHPEFNIDTGVTLLMEMDTEYDTLVQTMDAVRLIVRDERELDEYGNVIQGELFPNISMGDAPPEAAATTEVKNP
ncbi:ExbD/TolR family protein [Aliikangiella coralliicola]|uniref:Biopolymer transporter ExbD n=1 Tax=Aliikangiella coralliicola TaxID=2592383 RepID=A0A545U4Z2_9GAMM|nr:biopolymer transporter ExbD [Aliikangiella coralliicola]TQV84538.1 biopolymer transporter ExbD [Aliikangiella coralliicola]